ncbi:MAG: DUF4402 domain-containing protein [Gemmatimonadales bacterium]
MTRPAAVLSTLIGLAAVAGPAGAQTPTGSMATTAQVVSGPITLNVLRNLDFGQVPTGVPTTVAPNAAGAAAVQAIGSPNTLVNISFTLPTVLDNIQAQPGVTMPIVFLNNSARWRRARNNPNGGTQFNPANGAVGRFGPRRNPTLYIWLGGRVTPSAAQTPGIYTGTVVVTLEY